MNRAPDRISRSIEDGTTCASIRWERAGTQGIGVLVSDTLRFQRAAPQPSDANLSNFYGLALPLLLHGIPVEPVQIESTYSPAVPHNFLKPYKLLMLTYEGQKPPSPAFQHGAGCMGASRGALLFVDDGADPYTMHLTGGTPSSSILRIRASIFSGF